MKVQIVACARDENSNIVEWIMYYKNIGIDKIWLYCNDDDPISMFKTVYPFTQGENKFVNFIHFYGQGEQKNMYKHFINNHMENNTWVGFIDIDEFLTIKNNKNFSEILNNASKFDAIHFNWVNFGPSNNILDPIGLITKSLNRRNKFPSPHGKVFIQSSVIDKDWINNDRGVFFHGFGDQGKKHKHQPFSEKRAEIALCWGDNFYDLFESNFGGYAIENSEKIFSNCYLSHFQMKSFEHLARRAKRKISGDFMDQNKWRDMLFNNSFWRDMEPDNEIEDNFLRDAVTLSFSFEKASMEDEK